MGACASSLNQIVPLFPEAQATPASPGDTGAKKQDQLRGSAQMPLQQAAENGDADAVAQLLENSPECLDATDSDGNTALHLACRHQHEAVVRVLVLKGAKKDATNIAGQKPSDLLPTNEDSAKCASFLGQ